MDISWELCGHRFPIPIIAAAMDGVVSPSFAIEMGRVGGLAVLNLESGMQDMGYLTRRRLSPLAPSDAPHDGIAGFIDRPRPREPHQECEYEQPANRDKQNSGEQSVNKNEQNSGDSVTKQRNKNVHGSKCTWLQRSLEGRLC